MHAHYWADDYFDMLGPGKTDTTTHVRVQLICFSAFAFRARRISTQNLAAAGSNPRPATAPNSRTALLCDTQARRVAPAPSVSCSSVPRSRAFTLPSAAMA